jgi:hypothetical protein
MMRRRRRIIGGLCVGLVAWLCTVAVNGAFPVFASAGRAPAPGPARITPNRFDPTSRAASVTAAHLAAPATIALASFYQAGRGFFGF